MFIKTLGFRAWSTGLQNGPLPAVCSRMSWDPAHTPGKRSQNHADPHRRRRQVRSPVDPRATGVLDEDRPRAQDLLERGRAHATRRRPASTDSSGRGDPLRDLLVIGRWLLQAFLDMAGTGGVGPTLT